MKTSEMILELGNNPSKEFRRTRDGLIIKVDEYGHLRWPPGHDYLNLNDKWEEIKKPVSFMEALESERKVRVRHVSLNGNLNYLRETYNEIDDVLFQISRYLNNAGLRDILLYGTWYIE